jgi:hypothetical protein
MLDRPPRESEWLSWLYVALWSFVIFLTVPIARDLIDFVKGTWGLEVLTYGICVVIVLLRGINGPRHTAIGRIGKARCTAARSDFETICHQPRDRLGQD